MTLTRRGDWQTEETEALFEAILSLRTTEDARAFFRDLCTLQEIHDMSQRWAVALLLDHGLTYRQISEATGVSTATITRINHWLQHGQGGYRLVLDRRGKR
jgi:TrpR-related protein YerC/YecD